MFFKIRNHGTINTDVLQALLHYLIDQKKLPGNWVKIRSSHQRCSVKRGVLKNFANFTGKRMCWSLCLIKLQTWRPATLLKMRLQHRCFPVKIAKFLEIHVLKNTCEDCFCQKWNELWWTSHRGHGYCYYLDEDIFAILKLIFWHHCITIRLCNSFFASNAHVTRCHSVHPLTQKVTRKDLNLQNVVVKRWSSMIPLRRA